MNMLGCEKTDLLIPYMVSEVTFSSRGKRYLWNLYFHHLAQSCFPILLLSPLEECVALPFMYFILLYPSMLCAKLSRKLAQWLLSRKFLKVIYIYIFLRCCFYLPLEKWKGPWSERKWNLFTQKCCVFNWNWNGSSGEDFHVCKMFSLCCYYLPL